jgi:hypothetical protein
MEMIEENKMFDYLGSLAPTTAATEPVLEGLENIDGNNHFSTSPNLVQRTRAELENDIITERDILTGKNSGDFTRFLSSTGPTEAKTSAWLTGTACLLKTGNPSGTIERDIPSCSRGSERENETINDARVSGDELCLLETGNPSGTFDIPADILLRDL